MLFLALILIMVAAFLHAGWNVLAKVSKDTFALMWWASLFGTLGYGVWLLSSSGIYLNPDSWVPFIISAIAETGYFVTLVRAYSEGDLSLVYPISRGSAPIFAAFWSALVFAEKLPVLGYLGVGLIVFGIFIVSNPINRSDSSDSSWRFSSLFQKKAAGWALASAVFISVFSVSDKVAVAATPPLIYNWWVAAGNTVLWSPVVWRGSRLRANIKELKTNLRGIIATSIAITTAYAAALAALALTSASYVVAGRGFSVVIGAGLGALLLKESFGSSRVIGALIMVTGLVLIAFS
jgi:drug/metabolite transporter (DMT)-like permease